MRIILLKYFLFAFCSYLISGAALALEVTENSNEYSLSHALQYAVTSDKNFNPSSLGSIEQKSFFKHPPSSEPALNLGFTSKTVWIRVTLSKSIPASNTWILEIPYLGLDIVNLYLENGSVLKNGSDIALEKRPYFSRHYAFPITLTEQPSTFYLEISSSFPITIPLRLIQVNEFNKTQFTENLFQSLYFGGLLSLLLYNLVLFIIIRDKKYLIYSAFAGFTGLAIFAGNGYGRIYLWPDSIFWDRISQTTLFCAAGILALLFTMQLLRSEKITPVAYKLMYVLCVAYLSIGIYLTGSLFFTIPTSQIYLLFFSISIVTPVIALYASIRTVIAGANSAGYSLVGWGVFCIGTGIASLRIFDLIPNNVFTLYAIQISSAIEMLLFAFALAHHFQIEQAHKALIQKALLESKEETLNALRLTEEKLENAISMRTNKLQALLISEQHMRDQYVRFGAMIAHEFRNPLNIIQAQTTLLELDDAGNHTKMHSRTSIIRAAITRLTSLFDQWLESDRLSQAGTQIYRQKIELYSWLSSLANDCKTYYSNNTLNIVLEDGPVYIYGDDHLLQIAVLNLIENACKYSPMNAQIDVGVRRDDYGVGIYIKDSGVGIPIEMQEKILEPYIRVDNTKEAAGVGLGLAFVKRIMEAHDGRIEIESKPRHGTTITLWIPEYQINYCR